MTDTELEAEAQFAKLAERIPGYAEVVDQLEAFYAEKVATDPEWKEAHERRVEAGEQGIEAQARKNADELRKINERAKHDKEFRRELIASCRRAVVTIKQLRMPSPTVQQRPRESHGASVRSRRHTTGSGSTSSGEDDAESEPPGDHPQPRRRQGSSERRRRLAHDSLNAGCRRLSEKALFKFVSQYGPPGRARLLFLGSGTPPRGDATRHRARRHLQREVAIADLSWLLPHRERVCATRVDCDGDPPSRPNANTCPKTGCRREYERIGRQARRLRQKIREVAERRAELAAEPRKPHEAEPCRCGLEVGLRGHHKDDRVCPMCGRPKALARAGGPVYVQDDALTRDVEAIIEQNDLRSHGRKRARLVDSSGEDAGGWFGGWGKNSMSHESGTSKSAWSNLNPTGANEGTRYVEWNGNHVAGSQPTKRPQGWQGYHPCEERMGLYHSEGMRDGRWAWRFERKRLSATKAREAGHKNLERALCGEGSKADLLVAYSKDQSPKLDPKSTDDVSGPREKALSAAAHVWLKEEDSQYLEREQGRGPFAKDTDVFVVDTKQVPA